MKSPLLSASTAIALFTILTPATFAAQPTTRSKQPSTLYQQNFTNVSKAQSTDQLQTPTNDQKYPRCNGDAAKATPPIPNYPTQIRNVIWRNMRAMCT